MSERTAAFIACWCGAVVFSLAAAAVWPSFAPIQTPDAGIDAGTPDAGLPPLECHAGTDGKVWCCYDLECDASTGRCVFAGCYIKGEGEP